MDEQGDSRSSALLWSRVVRRPSVRPSSLTFHIFDLSFETTKRNSTKLYRNKISSSSTKFVIFGPIGKTRWPPRPLIGWDIFDFSSETTEWNSSKLDTKQDLNVLYQVCVFRAHRKNKIVVLADPSKKWHIVLRCTICCSLGPLFSAPEPLNGFWRNLTGSKYSTSLNLCNFSPLWPTQMANLATDWQKKIFHLSANVEKISVLLDKKQVFKVLYQVFFFGLICE